MAIGDLPQQGGVYVVGTNLGTITMDLLQEESAEEALEKICKEAGIQISDIVFTWASPPCETYSRANWSNLSRGNHYREPSAGHRPTSGEKGRKAEEHDKLAIRIKEMLAMLKTTAMENPAGGLEHCWHMLDYEAQRKLVDLCAYGWPFKKPTSIWTNGFDWEPMGNTGTGRCESKCQQGMKNPATGKFAHFHALAMHPQRGTRGVGASRQKNGMPKRLLAEILWNAAQTTPLEGRVVLDLCAGFQSLREVALEAGADYLAVDLKGERGDRDASSPRVAIMLRAGDLAYAPDHKLPQAKVVKHETAWTAIRGKLLELGLEWGLIESRVLEMPMVYERDGLTLFVCELSLPPPQVPDKDWIGMRRLEAAEDDVMLVRLLEEERTTSREEPAKAVGGARQRRGGCKDLRRY